MSVIVSPLPTTPTAPPPGRTTPLLRWALAIVLAIGLLSGLYLPETDWPAPARHALALFGLALIGWTVLRLPDTPVALAAALALPVLGVVEPQAVYAGLGDSLVWLLIGAFVLGAVVQSSGLAERWALQAVAGAGSTERLMLRLSGVIIATAFVVPSTSGRAALLLPLFLALAQAIGQPRITRALALLFPSVILLSACGSLLGAGAHLVAVDFMRHLGLPAPDFLTWMVWMTPLAVLSSLAATLAITRLFLRADERRARPELPAPPREPLKPLQKRVAVITALAVLGWATSGWHGWDAAQVALAAALLATCKGLTGIDLKSALKKVEWNLLLFMAVTLVLGHALLDSGAAKVITAALLQALPVATLPLPLVVVLMALIALLSHLLITSRTARALVLLPTVALPLAATGVNPALLILLAVVGSGFCQTLVISAKPVALFARAELPPAVALDPRAHDRALLQLSVVLLPLMLLLLLATALWQWPLMGVALRG
jgi:solute carrier family 13 (sodium-dependent dicarboxylate transporter), member 2/3/5